MVKEEPTITMAMNDDVEIAQDLPMDDESKRARSQDDESEEGNGCKKQKISTSDDKLGEEKRIDEKVEETKVPEVEDAAPVNLGPKSFPSSTAMFEYFYNLLHYWPPHININKYEQMVLIELLKKGHAEPDKKIGSGIKAFLVKNHPTYNSRCFFLIREDDTVDDFSFRKCVDRILPLPGNLKLKPEVNNTRFGRGGGRGHHFRGGRGNKFNK